MKVEKVLREMWPQIKFYCEAVKVRSNEAEDFMQEVSLKICKVYKKFDKDRSAMKTFFSGVIRREVLRLRMKALRTEDRVFKAEQEYRLVAPNFFESAELSCIKKEIRRQTKRTIRKIYEKTSGNRKRIFDMVLAEKSKGEIKKEVRMSWWAISKNLEFIKTVALS